MAKRYLIETFGCQMNVHDSERMAGLLDQAGYESTDDDRDADVIVINTCSVREKAEEKLYTRLGEIRVLADETGTQTIVAAGGGPRTAADRRGGRLRRAAGRGEAPLEDERSDDRRARGNAEPQAPTVAA